MASPSVGSGRGCRVLDRSGHVRRRVAGQGGAPAAQRGRATLTRGEDRRGGRASGKPLVVTCQARLVPEAFVAFLEPPQGCGCGRPQAGLAGRGYGAAMAAAPFVLATAQLPISGDARVNARHVRATMREAAAQGARLVHFPEGMLSGYAKNPIQDWTEVDWGTVREELELAMALAAELRLWVVLGSAHPLTPPHWPHNSLYVISDAGEARRPLRQAEMLAHRAHPVLHAGLRAGGVRSRRLPLRHGHLYRDQLLGPVRGVRPAWRRLPAGVGLPGRLDFRDQGPGLRRDPQLLAEL